MAVGNNIQCVNVYSYSVFSLNICGNKCSFIYLFYLFYFLCCRLHQRHNEEHWSVRERRPRQVKQED
jgi:hypothetical protein